MKKKEAIQILSAIVNGGVLNGDFASMSTASVTNSTDPLVQYFTSKLNVLQCPMGKTTYPCNHNAQNYGVTNPENNHSARWVLPNNTKISFNGWGGVSLSRIRMTVDTKEKGTPTQGAIDADQLSIVSNLDSGYHTEGC